MLFYSQPKQFEFLFFLLSMLFFRCKSNPVTYNSLDTLNSNNSKISLKENLSKRKKLYIKNQNDLLTGLNIDNIKSLDDFTDENLSKLDEKEMTDIHYLFLQGNFLSITKDNYFDDDLLQSNMDKAKLITKYYLKKTGKDFIKDFESFSIPTEAHNFDDKNTVTNVKQLINDIKNDTNESVTKLKNHLESSNSPIDFKSQIDNKSFLQFIFELPCDDSDKISLLDKLLKLGKFNFSKKNKVEIYKTLINRAHNGKISPKDLINYLKYLKNNLKLYIPEKEKNDLKNIILKKTKSLPDKQTVLLYTFANQFIYGSNTKSNKKDHSNIIIPSKEYKKYIDENTKIYNTVLDDNESITNYIDSSNTNINKNKLNDSNIEYFIKTILDPKSKIFNKMSSFKNESDKFTIFHKLEYRKKLFKFISEKIDPDDLFENGSPQYLTEYILNCLTQYKNKQDIIYQQYFIDIFKIVCTHTQIDIERPNKSAFKDYVIQLQEQVDKANNLKTISNLLDSMVSQ